MLNSLDQYVSELWQTTPRLSPEQERQVVEKARNGDKAAKNALIENCLSYVLHMARVYAVYLEHDDLLDIVGVGNLAVAEKVDQSLTKENPGAYLCGVAKQSIRKYCLYRSRLIPVNNHALPIAEFPRVTSLDTIEENGDIPIQPEQTNQEETDQERLSMVRQALAKLTSKQREVIEMRYGFNATTGPLRLEHVADHLAMKPAAIEKRYRHAIRHLRAMLPKLGIHL